MDYTASEEALRKLFQEAYNPVSSPPGTRELIGAHVMAELNNSAARKDSLWSRPRLMVPILASIAAGLIAYGFWLSATFV